MRLRICFGLIDNKEVFWYQELKAFPTIINFLGRNFEWVMYDKDPTQLVDHILYYTEIPTYDPNYGVICPVWNEMFKDVAVSCECGADKTSFNWDHMRFCKKWRPW